MCCTRNTAFILPLLFGFFLFTKQQKMKVCTCCHPRNVAITLQFSNYFIIIYTIFFSSYYPLFQQNTEYHHYYVSQSLPHHCPKCLFWEQSHCINIVYTHCTTKSCDFGMQGGVWEEGRDADSLLGVAFFAVTNPYIRILSVLTSLAIRISTSPIIVC